jgi:hypothetical protein
MIDRKIKYKDLTATAGIILQCCQNEKIKQKAGGACVKIK